MCRCNIAEKIVCSECLSAWRKKQEKEINENRIRETEKLLEKQKNDEQIK